MIISLAEAKEYLRVDTDEEDSLIENLLTAAEKLCCDVARLDEQEFEATGEIGKVAVLYTLGNFYQKREESEQKELTLRLRSLLFGVRKAAF